MRLACSSAALTLLLASAASAQSVWGVSGPALLASRVTGPPAGPCAYPSGPVLNVFPYPAPWACPTPGPFQQGPRGDITVDRINDTVWISDGLVITNYTKGGAVLNSFPAPLAAGVTGLGWGTIGALNVLWVTDGMLATAVVPPPAPGCIPGVVVVPPFPVAFPGLASDIDYDPRSNTIFTSNLNGMVANQLVGGAPGPFGVFAPGGCVAAPLLGLCVDSSGCNLLYVSNGVILAHITMAGLPAPPTFYCPNPCVPWAGPGPIQGLGFDAAPIRYGAACDPSAGTLPTIASTGEALSPSTGLTLSIVGADPGNAFLLVGPTPACPPVPFGACQLFLFPIALIVGPIPHGGAATLAPAIPAGLPCGTRLFIQWINAKTGGGFETTEGMEMTFSVP